MHSSFKPKWGVLLGLFLTVSPLFAAENVIENQLKEIGRIPDEEVLVVQRKYTKKDWRSEITPINFGGIPFGSFRQTLFGGASYTLHLSDSFAWEAVNFLYVKNFLTSFTDEVNLNKDPSRVSSQVDIRNDFQKLLYMVTTGVVWTPIYGKFSTFSRWIAYTEPFISFGVGVTQTEKNQYVAFAPGVGLRTFFREWFSMKLELKDYIYTEQTVDRTTGAAVSFVRNNYAVMFSLSFWLPQLPNS